MWDDDEPEYDVGDEAPEPGSFVRSALIFYGVLGCAALLWRMAPTPGDSILYPTMGAEAGAFGFLPAIGIGLFVGLVTIAAGELLTEYTDLEDGLAELVGETFSGLTTVDAILLAIASGLGEEMLFRGALQPSVGIVWASLIFGACHFVPRRDLMWWSLYAVAMGFVFGILYEWSGNLAAPVAAHAVVNGVNLPRLARRFEERRAEEEAAAESSTNAHAESDDERSSSEDEPL